MKKEINHSSSAVEIGAGARRHLKRSRGGMVLDPIEASQTTSSGGGAGKLSNTKATRSMVDLGFKKNCHQNKGVWAAGAAKSFASAATAASATAASAGCIVCSRGSMRFDLGLGGAVLTDGVVYNRWS